MVACKFRNIGNLAILRAARQIFSRLSVEKLMFENVAVKFCFLNRLVSKVVFKGAISGLRKFLATESPLKIMKNTFYFTFRALFMFKLFKFLC